MPVTGSIPAIMNRAAFVFFIATLIFAPLAFGTTEEWSKVTVQLFVSCCSLCLFLSLNNKKESILKVPGLLPLALFVLWMFLQFLPFPASFVQLIAPSVNDIYKPIYDVSSQNEWVPLTVNQKATFFEFMRVASYVLFYVLTVQILSNGARLKKTVRIVSYLGIAIAFLAIIQKFTSPDKIYWFRSTPENAGTVGPWVYHNHYAGFMEMMCPLVLALFLFYRPSVDHNKPLRSRIAAAFTMPGSNLHFFLGFGVVVIVLSIFVSLSRGGIISLSLALVLFLAILPRRIIKFKFVTYGFLAGSVVLMFTWFGWGALLDKFSATFTDTGTINNIRIFLWQDSLKIISDFWLTGSGPGTFIHIYPLYTTLSTDFILDHAHNDYIELITDSGIVGFVLASWFMVTIIVYGMKGIQFRRDRFAILLSIGALAGISAILFHSFTDFNMYNGANGLYFFFLCGLLVSAGNTRLYYRTKPTLLEPASARSKYLLLIAAILLLGSTLFIRGGAIVASATYAKVANTYLNKNLHAEKIKSVAVTSKRASQYDPLEGKYSFALGSAQVFLFEPENALASFVKASRKDPLSGIYLQRLALMLSAVDKNGAEKLMPIAYERALKKEPLILTWVEWLLSVNEREKAVVMLRKVFAKKPQLVKKFMPVLSLYAFDRQEIVNMLPESVSAWVHYGELVEKQGKIADAEFYRKRALDFLDREEVVRPWYFNQLYWFYHRHNKNDQAFTLLREASERLPEYAKFHVYLGDHYAKEGIIYRAIEEYEQALLFEPADEKTRRKLEGLKKK